MLRWRVRYPYPIVIEDAITLVSHTALQVQVYKYRRSANPGPAFLARRPGGAREVLAWHSDVGL